MSPEQARGEKVDHRADLYGLAAIVYRSAVRRPPFSGKDLGPVLYRVVHDMPDRPSSVLDIPEDVDAFLAIGLAKARDDRFGSARELAVAFRAAIGGTLAPELRERAKQILVKRPYTDQALRNKRLRKVRNR
jgi:serine/threonine-protein kinase